VIDDKLEAERKEKEEKEALDSSLDIIHILPEYNDEDNLLEKLGLDGGDDRPKTHAE